MELAPRNDEERSRRLETMEEILSDVPAQPESSLHYCREEMRIEDEKPKGPRKFPIYHYRKALDFVDQLALDDAFENCPSPLKDELDKIITLHSKKTPNKLALQELINRVILVGPSGGGKTTFSYAIAYHCKYPFSFVRAPELCDSFKDSCPQIINDLIDPFIKSNQPGLIIIDEASAFTKKLKKKNDSDTGAVEGLWAKFDEARSLNPQLMVILTANKLKHFPKTLLTRFRGTRTTIDLPSAERQLSIISKFFQKSGGEDERLTKETAQQARGLSLREVSLALYRARGNARIRCELQDIPLRINDEDVTKALKPFLEEHMQDVWNKRKKKLTKAAKAAWPYIFQTIMVAGGSYLGWRIYKQQAAQTQKNHDESINLQLMQHGDNQVMNEYHHQETLRQSDRHHDESINLQLIQHCDNQVVTEYHHQETLRQSDRHHSENMQLSREQHVASQAQAKVHQDQSLRQARELHNDTHSPSTIAKQAAISTATSIVTTSALIVGLPVVLSVGSSCSIM